MNPFASAGSTWPIAFTSMLRIVNGAPGVSAAGFPSSPVTDAVTAAFAVAGTQSTVATTAAARNLPPDFMLLASCCESIRRVPTRDPAERFVRFKTQPPRWAPRPMSVIVDPIRRYEHIRLAVKDWCHLAVDGSFEELHGFAA